MQESPRSKAIRRGLKTYFTGKPCPHGHHARRYTTTRGCVTCAKAAQKKWHYANLAYRQLMRRLWLQRNPGYGAKHRKTRDPNKVAAEQRAWQKANPGTVNARNARRRASKLQATPTWADHAAIKAIYDKAAARGLTVDHVIPLQNPAVCGLHVDYNLQLLTHGQNTRKGSSFDPDDQCSLGRSRQLTPSSIGSR